MPTDNLEDSRGAGFFIIGKAFSKSFFYCKPIPKSIICKCYAKIRQDRKAAGGAVRGEHAAGRDHHQGYGNRRL